MKNNILKIFFLLFLVGCNKDDDKKPADILPLATQIGANTAGCIINGKVLVPKNGFSSLTAMPIYGLRYYIGPQFQAPDFNDYFSIGIYDLQNKTGQDYWIYVYLDQVTNGVGEYNLGQSNQEYYSQGPNNPQIIVREEFNGLSWKTYSSTENSGTITITKFDYENKIYSGTFNAVLQNADNPLDKIYVTNGQFDINTLTLNN